MTSNNNQENIQKPVIQQTFNFNAPIGQMIAHVDKIEAHFDKGMGMQVMNAESVDSQGFAKQSFTSQGSQSQGAAIPSASLSPTLSPDEEWIDELLSCFMGIKENALEFVKAARRLQPKQITSLVNTWVAQRKISELSCKRDLWKPLHAHGIYPCSESNWNSQVK